MIPAGPPRPVPSPPAVDRTIPFSPVRRSARSSSLGATTRNTELQPSIAPPSTLRRLTDTQSASSAIAVSQSQLALQQNQLAVQTQVPPDTPERALLRQQRDYFEEQAAWIADVAERDVYQAKHRNYVKLENTFANYKEEFHQAAAEHRHRCQLEITAQANQLALANEVERQQSNPL